MEIKRYFDNHNSDGNLVCPECNTMKIDGYKWLPTQDNPIAKLQGWWSRCCDCNGWFPERIVCTATDVPL